MSITEETRRESYQKIDIRTRQAQIMMCIGDRIMTAREIAAALGYQEMNHVRPRITELAQAGLLVEEGVKYDVFTHRNVTCWRKNPQPPAPLQNLSLRAAAEMLKPKYPKITYPLLCVAQRPTESGVTLTGRCRRDLRAARQSTASGKQIEFSGVITGK